jgi:uncharacterized protein (TIGR02147 family)
VLSGGNTLLSKSLRLLSGVRIPWPMTSILDYDNYRTYLKDVLEEKCKKNPAFSLRSFSLNIGMSPSHLSRVLSGGKRLSATMAQQISHRLQHSQAETAHFYLIVQLESAKDADLRHDILKQVSSQTAGLSRFLGLERFKVISDWQHFAILALTKMKAFKSDPDWIAGKLGMRRLEALSAIDRLVLVELLEKTPNGKLKPVEGTDISTSDDISSSAIKENHRQQMARADLALSQQPVELREFNNLAITMKPKDMAVAKKKIREFVEQFNREMDSSAGTELFQLNIQFFQSSVGDENLK